MTPRAGAHHHSITCMNCSLRRVCIPAALAEDEVPRFDAIVQRPKTLDAGLDVVLPGTPFDRIHILRVGHLQEFVQPAPGRRRVTGYALPSDMVGFEGFARNAHVTGARSLETVAVCAVPREGLKQLATELPALTDQVLVKFSERLLHTQRLQLVVGRHTARERVAALLLSHSERAERIRWSPSHLRLPMPYVDIAESLSISGEALSRTLRQMADDGILAMDRNEVEILDHDRLVAAADGPAQAVPPLTG